MLKSYLKTDNIPEQWNQDMAEVVLDMAAAAEAVPIQFSVLDALRVRHASPVHQNQERKPFSSYPLIANALGLKIKKYSTFLS